MTAKGVRVACEFWRKNYRGRYYVTSWFDEKGREEELAEGRRRFEARLAGIRRIDLRQRDAARGFQRNKLASAT